MRQKTNKLKIICKISNNFIIPLFIALIAGYILLFPGPSIVMVFKDDTKIREQKHNIKWENVEEKNINNILSKNREEIVKESLIFYNNSIIPGFIDKVEITPETIFKPFVKIEVLEVDKRKLYFFWSYFYPEIRTVKVKYVYTDSLLINEKGMPIKEEINIGQFKWCFYDNKGQFINCHDNLIIHLSEQNIKKIR